MRLLSCTSILDIIINSILIKGIFLIDHSLLCCESTSCHGKDRRLFRTNYSKLVVVCPMLCYDSVFINILKNLLISVLLYMVHTPCVLNQAACL
jgi:hypothetical protein